MPITITCPCGKTATVPDHFAGRTGRCGNCGAEIVVPPQTTPTHPPEVPPPPRPTLQPAPVQKAASSELDPVFARDSFLLRQKHLSINEKYAVWDETGTALLFVERPAHLMRNILALLAAAAAAMAVFTLVAFTYQLLPEGLRDLYVTLGVLTGIIAIFAVYIMLEQKRHVEFYRDEQRGEKLLRVIQDTKIQLLNATYTVTDAGGKSIGTFSKNYLWDIIFKRWECRDPRGKLLFKVQEDSVIKAILRRFFGPLLGLLRLDFVFCDPVSGEEIGRFNRSFTLLDRYVLDMGNDRGRRVDRRLALAMGVMLDTGEKR